MTLAKGAALGLGFAGAVALGVLIGPHITDRGRTATDMASPAAQATAASTDEHQAAPQVRRAPTSSRAATTRRTADASTTTPAPLGETPRVVPAAAPALHEMLKPLLNKGADMGIASQEFADAEQFAAVAHASRNTDVPFMVLKHRVVEEGKTLEDAIRELKPDLNAAAEAQRARSEAKSDISALEG